MSVICRDIIKQLEIFAPLKYAEEWDNIGLIIGDDENFIKKAIVCLDITNDIIDDAIEKKANLIISHHPFIFKSIKNINTTTELGKKIIKCIQNNICVYSAHTNLDMTIGGTNDKLFDILNLKDKDFLCEEVDKGYALGRVGNLNTPMTLLELSMFVKNKLNLDIIKYIGNKEKIVNKVSICTGSCSNDFFFEESLKKNCDVYITSDIKHHEALDAKELGLSLIDATHYGTEVIICSSICKLLNDWAKENKIDFIAIQSHKEKQIFENI